LHTKTNRRRKKVRRNRQKIKRDITKSKTSQYTIKSRYEEKKLDKEQKAQIIALQLGEVSKGFTHWSLQLLADKKWSKDVIVDVYKKPYNPKYPAEATNSK
jgi:hypothetical protein